MTRLEDIEQRAVAATPGPWHRHTFGHASTISQTLAVGKALKDTSDTAGFPMTDLTWLHDDNETSIGLTGNGPAQVENADFIANARSDIPWLVERVRKLEAALRDAIQVIDDSYSADPSKWPDHNAWHDRAEAVLSDDAPIPGKDVSGWGE